MKKRELRKHRRALNITVLIYLLLDMLIALLVAIGIVVLLLHFELLPAQGSGQADSKYVILFMALINLVSGAIVITLTNRWTLKYINRVINQMNRLANGDFKARLSFGTPMDKHPTVREVTESFNAMAEQLDGTEMLRSDFINNFSHEFKTPIVSIAGFAKLLKRGNLTKEQRMEYLDIIEEESLRLSAMATNVLNMTKVENQTILTNVTRFNLSEQLRNSVLMLESKWTKKQIEFELNFKEHMIEANEELLKHVWVNLIDNAIKFSPDYGTVEVAVTEQEERIFVTISNNGSKIPEDKIKHIFNKFYQADESHTSEGNGIGLALVKGVTQLHGGEVSVKSDNHKTSFTVELPGKQM